MSNRKQWIGLSALALAAVGVLAAARHGSAVPEAPADPGEQYTLAIYETAEDFALRDDKSEKGAAYWAKWNAYHGQLQAAGVLRGGMPLQGPATVSQVRVRDGKTLVAAGPVNAQPILGGYMIVQVKDRQTAVDWAAKAPNASTGGVVEVRPALKIAMPAAR